MTFTKNTKASPSASSKPEPSFTGPVLMMTLRTSSTMMISEDCGRNCAQTSQTGMVKHFAYY